MKLILTRKISNPSCTLGELTSDDGLLRLVTKEARLPTDRESYIMWLLPPKTYKVHIEYGAIVYKDKTIHAYWPMFKRIPWFPRAGFFTGTQSSALKGKIKLGTEYVDDYNISGDIEACQQLLRWVKDVYDRIGEDYFDLEIIQDESAIQFSDISQEEYLKSQQLTQEKDEQEEVMNEIYGNLIKD